MTPRTLEATAMTIVAGNELSSAAKQRTEIQRIASIAFQYRCNRPEYTPTPDYTRG